MLAAGVVAFHGSAVPDQTQLQTELTVVCINHPDNDVLVASTSAPRLFEIPVSAYLVFRSSKSITKCVDRFSVFDSHKHSSHCMLKPLQYKMLLNR